MFRRFAISFLLVFVGICAWGRTRPHYGGTLHVEIEGDPWTGPDGLVRQLVLDGLTRLGSDGAVEPALATEWLSDDSVHRWEFRLRPGVQFQDGSQLNATTVVQSLNLSCNANCPWSAVRAVGSSVVFTADSPMPNLPALLAEDKFLIALTVTASGATPANVIGTGPFQFSAQNNGVLTLAANENCWAGRPFLDSIEFHAHRTIRDQWLDLNLGRADVAEVPPEDLRQAQQQRLAVKVSPPVELLALQVSDTGALANPMFRGSIAAAVDRSALFNVIFQKQGEITASLLPQELSGYAFIFSTDRDLNKAHALRGGLTAPPLTLSYEGDGALQLAAQRLALNLHEAGFDVQVVDAAHATHVDLMVRRLPIAMGPPAVALETAMRAAGEAVSVGAQSPPALFRIEREFLDHKTLVPLLDLPRAYAIGPRVRDFVLRADGRPDLASVSLEDAP
ncbi:MAG TPA: ABC transporter substrate-binding protein [Terracidiphilus sp.]|nr:ABC transporter substrate-binding protein [Terracidiphilus sp.]